MGHVRLLQERGEMGDLTDPHLQMALAVTAIEHNLSAATARHYRAAVIHVIRTTAGSMKAEALEILYPEKSVEQLERQDWLAQKRHENKANLVGSQQRADYLSYQDTVLLLKELNECKRAFGSVAAVWYLCTTRTGLRPCEWQHAKLIGTDLLVKNAKATNGRAHGETRTIQLYRAQPEVLETIQHLLGIMKKYQGVDFTAMYHSVRDAIATVARRVLSSRRRYPSLYTARHCFSAAAKNSFSKAEVAALMGHASLETAPRHYASAWRARGGVPLEVDPSNADVDAIMRLQSVKRAMNFMDRKDEA